MNTNITAEKIAGAAIGAALTVGGVAVYAAHEAVQVTDQSIAALEATGSTEQVVLLQQQRRHQIEHGQEVVFNVALGEAGVAIVSIGGLMAARNRRQQHGSKTTASTRLQPAMVR